MFYQTSIEFPFLLIILVFLAFAVKLPIFGLHFWLPIAHVEAPTFGSMILAGVLLKLGGIGLYRLAYVFDFSKICLWLTAYLVVALTIVTLICCYQSDFKRLVAYSSVSHILAVPLLFFSNTSISFKRLVLVIFFHGLRSPLIFLLVSLLYTAYSTRQLPILRGVLTFSPFLRLLALLTFFFTMSAPPFPSFVREVLFFISSSVLTP